MLTVYQDLLFTLSFVYLFLAAFSGNIDCKSFPDSSSWS